MGWRAPGDQVGGQGTEGVHPKDKDTGEADGDMEGKKRPRLLEIDQPWPKCESHDACKRPTLKAAKGHSLTAQVVRRWVFGLGQFSSMP